jgi:argininosuccinate lyase
MAKKLWGGRFTKPIDPAFERFSRSVHYDYKFAEYDLVHSLIHVNALFHAGFVTEDERAKLTEALSDLLEKLGTDEFEPDLSEEDIHSQIQNALEKKLGSTAKKLHTLRSRNDQIAFDAKMYCYDESQDTAVLLDAVIAAFREAAATHANEPFVGYTHTQRAQVISFGAYCGAYAEMFDRDRQRLTDFLTHFRITIGAGALAGSSIPFQAYEKAAATFAKETGINVLPVTNSLEHVADRDFAMEFLSILSILQMHISRLAEDMILYSTKEFDYLDLPEEFCTGSSLMPHKKNADFMELARGATGRVYGAQLTLMTLMKGLPLTYNRDMQLDKEPLFDAVETVQDLLEMLARFVPGITVKEDNVAKALDDELFYGVEIAEYLVNHGVPFSTAHELVGKLIRHSEEHSVAMKAIDDSVLAKEFHPSLTRSALTKIMAPRAALANKRSIKK